MSIREEETKKKKILGSMGNEGSKFFKVIIFPSVLEEALFVSTSHMRNANRLLLNNTQHTQKTPHSVVCTSD